MNPLLEKWFEGKKWKLFEFQHKAVTAYAKGESGLIHAPTGMGKTYAAWLGPLDKWIKENPDSETWASGKNHSPVPPKVLWITPLRALASDTLLSLQEPLHDLGIPWSVAKRTGDVSSSKKKAVMDSPPTALITTPESFSLMLTQPDFLKQWETLEAVIVDEWHEMLGNKRGVMTELCLARLRTLLPHLRVWGVSATLGNIEQAMQVLLGVNQSGVLVKGAQDKEIIVETIRPQKIENFPWAGHLGVRLLPDVLKQIDLFQTTLLFTNTRAMAELWFQEIMKERPEWEHIIALHHGSLDRELRNMYEEGLKQGKLKCVVCTSSLDLGVDFSPVEQVIQVGSPKGVARLLQRAGRSGHQPGKASRILCVPTHAFELIEFAAVRDAVQRLEIEDRETIPKPLDLLVQHLVTLALGGGFQEKQLYKEVRGTSSFSDLSEEEWQWVLSFITYGGKSLKAYDRFARVQIKDGLYIVEDAKIAKFHRMAIGTISSYQSVRVKYLSGGDLGTVEEAFIGRLKVGDKFVFSGKVLQLVRFHAMTAYVKAAAGKTNAIPRWAGGRMPLSSELSAAVRKKIYAISQGDIQDEESRNVAPILAVQSQLSKVPEPDELLIETMKSRDGFHLFIYPFAGRLVHEGLGPLIANRITQGEPRSFSIAQNDYGIELLSPTPFNLDESILRKLLSPENLIEDILQSLASTELPRYQFREIARIAGLVFEGYPGARKTGKQLQVSSNLLFDVFTQFEPENLLLEQARREVLDRQMEIKRMKNVLHKLQSMKFCFTEPDRFTPFCFPILVDRLRHQMTNESWEIRVERLVTQLEKPQKKKRNATP
ncbi:MAG: ligase-associated DNA damage response DEXH box helicase [Sumerlaeia bacterium]